MKHQQVNYKTKPKAINFINKDEKNKIKQQKLYHVKQRSMNLLETKEKNIQIVTKILILYIVLMAVLINELINN